jgi:hypothetical protein
MEYGIWDGDIPPYGRRRHDIPRVFQLRVPVLDGCSDGVMFLHGCQSASLLAFSSSVGSCFGVRCVSEGKVGVG